MADASEDASAALLLSLLVRKRRRSGTSRKKKRFWVREFLKERKNQGDFLNLVRELRFDREMFFRSVTFQSFPLKTHA
jgi:hypothetical protein